MIRESITGKDYFLCWLESNLVVYVVLNSSEEFIKNTDARAPPLQTHSSGLFIYLFFNCATGVFLSLFYFIFKLYIIVLVLPNIKMNPSQVYMCSPS